jgi:ribosomal protein L32
MFTAIKRSERVYVYAAALEYIQEPRCSSLGDVKHAHSIKAPQRRAKDVLILN